MSLFVAEFRCVVLWGGGGGLLFFFFFFFQAEDGIRDRFT